MNKMILANLVHRPMRSLISVIAIAVEVTLILLIVGLSLGMLNDAKNRTLGIGADLLVQPPGSSNLMGISGAPVPMKVADVIRKVPHVAVVAPVVWNLSTSGTLEVIDGIDQSFSDLKPFQYVAGGPMQNDYDALVDDYLATSKNIKVGDPISILNHEFHVSGIVVNGRGARKFVPLPTLQDLIGAQGKASIFYVKVDNEANIESVRSAIQSIPGMGSYKIVTMSEYLSMMTASNLPGLKQFIEVVIGVAVIIGFIVIFQAMYTAVMERTREIGILKSMGASKLYVVNIILRETVVLAISGVILGIGLSMVARYGIHAKLPTLPIQIANIWKLYATLIAIGGAILGALYPAFKAAQKDPIEALAYE
jgi:putative ABC transport system permease protein